MEQEPNRIVLGPLCYALKYSILTLWLIVLGRSMYYCHMIYEDQHIIVALDLAHYVIKVNALL